VSPSTHLVTTVPGTLPVVLTCGHDGGQQPPGLEARRRYPFDGWLFPTFSTQRDIKTGMLTDEVAAALTATLKEPPVIIRAEFGRTWIDVNRERMFAYSGRAASPFWTEYHRQIRTFVRRLKVGILLDIHGTSIPEADLYLGTVYGASCSWWITETFARCLMGMGYRVVIDHPRLSGGFTVQAHGACNGGLDALQIEVARPLRLDTDRRLRLAQDLANVVAVGVHGFRKS